jgi:hypothetical protein
MSEPTKITEKYLAGFVDADGSFGIRFVLQNGVWISRMFLGVCQENTKDKVIHLIAASFGGKPYVRVGGQFKRENTAIEYSAKQARMILSRIAKYLVCKRSFAKFCIDYALTHRGRTYTPEEVEVEKRTIAEARAAYSYPLPNYPSRQWLAGYFDGDGCIASKVHVGKSSASGVIAARVEDDRREGRELLLKAFGGAIYPNGSKASSVWVVNLDPSKAKKFLRHFAKHSIVKRSQIYFALGCAEGGNYRDGDTIHRSLQLLKAQEQRLSDPEVNVSFLLKKVRFDVPDGRGRTTRTLKRQSIGEAA